MPTAPVLLVTGGSRGIGAAVVRQAHSAGIKVGFSYAGDHAAAMAMTRDHQEIIAAPGDNSDASFVRALFDQVEARLGPVTLLVNNAGITGRIGPFVDLPEEAMRRTIDVNLIGTMLTAQEAVRRWLERGTAGRIVNISSVAATLGAPREYVHYAASKAAVETFTIGLGKELAGQGIRVNAVSPGTAQTEIHARGGDPDRPARVARSIPMGRVGEPGEIANAVLWLLSDEASFVTASVLRVSGGS